jgi:hypothetical protein
LEVSILHWALVFLIHLYHRSRFWVWRHRRDGDEYRADTVLHILGDLPDHACHGRGRPTATAADLTAPSKSTLASGRAPSTDGLAKGDRPVFRGSASA